jgi:hypothetical protein
MSTVYDTSYSDAAAQADGTTGALAVKSISNQFVTNSAIAAVTDFVMSQPTRRYHVAVNYTALADDVTTTPNELNNLATTGAKAVAIYRNTTSTTQEDGTSPAWGSAYYRTSNMGFPTAADRTLCLNSITIPGQNSRFNREETTPGASTTDFTISPVVPAATSTVYVCGEAAVISVNNAGIVGASSLNASVARKDISFTSDYADGWMRFSTLAANGTSGLPILGAAFIRASNGAVNYGFTYSHKVTR